MWWTSPIKNDDQTTKKPFFANLSQIKFCGGTKILVFFNSPLTLAKI